MQNELIQQLAIAFEATGTELSKATMKYMVETLEQHPPGDIKQALDRCARHVKGRLSLAHILEQLDNSDGRPGPDEAWAMTPKGEHESAMMTVEMGEALDVIRLDMADKVAARKSFQEIYNRLVFEAREQHKPIKWFFSPGHDKAGRERVARDAVRKGILTEGEARQYCPEMVGNEEKTKQLPPAPSNPALPPPARDGKKVLHGQAVHDYVASLKKQMGVTW